jgi:hypothetical protein
MSCHRQVTYRLVRICNPIQRRPVPHRPERSQALDLIHRQRKRGSRSEPNAPAAVYSGHGAPPPSGHVHASPESSAPHDHATAAPVSRSTPPPPWPALPHRRPAGSTPTRAAGRPSPPRHREERAIQGGRKRQS